MSTFLEALKAEIQSLEQALEQDARFRRWRELRERVLALYDDKAPREAYKTKLLTHSYETKNPQGRERALAIIIAFLKAEDRIVHVREILNHLASHDIHIGGTNPANNLSALLSQSRLFQAHGRRGWTMKD